MGILHTIKATLSDGLESKSTFDPATLNDPVALQTKWSPAKAGGTNICTHSLQEVSFKRLEFKAKIGAFLFSGLFMVVGLGVGVGMSIGGLRGDMTMLYIGLPFGSVFFLAGYLVQRGWLCPRVFDFNCGYYWKGRIKASSVGKELHGEECKLKEIHAIQLLQERCQSSNSNGGGSSYYSYELNLVLKTGKRFNVIDHGKRDVIVADAKKLASFLKVPVWDVTHGSKQ